MTRRRKRVVGVGVVAVLAAVVTLLGVTGNLPFGTADGGSGPASASTPGTCVTWTQAAETDAVAIACSQPHLFELAGLANVADEPTYPNDARWRVLVDDRCTPIVTHYLGERFDPLGRYVVGGVQPSTSQWAAGDQALRCGLRVRTRSGAPAPATGTVAESDQSAIQPVGTCLAIVGRAVGDPASCSGPHAVEVAAVVDLARKFTAAFPETADQDAYLRPMCAKVADAYAAGSGVIAAKKLTVFWDNLDEASWNAGSRRVNCLLGALLPDRSGFAPITGSVRDPVTEVGTTPLNVAPTTGLPR